MERILRNSFSILYRYADACSLYYFFAILLFTKRCCKFQHVTIVKLLNVHNREQKQMSKPMGMMSGCYFVGRGELIQWINDLLCLSYTKVEDTCNGAAFCQVIDAIHPGTVALGKVKFDAYSPNDMIANYKVLQDAFHKNGIKQYFDVPTLIKGKYMAALELFQWIHGYYMQTGPHDEYDAIARRKHFKCKEPTGAVKAGQANAIKPAGMAKRTKPVAGVVPECNLNSANVPTNYGDGSRNVPVGAIPNAKSANIHADLNQRAEPKRKAVVRKEEAKPKKPVATISTAHSEAITKELEQEKKHVTELEAEVDQVTSEREFYYGKLRKIEEFCQDHEDNDIVKQILEIMYEADEENGFVAPENAQDSDDDDEDDDF